MKLSRRLLKQIYLALEEDIGIGDCTSSLFFSESEEGIFSLYARENGIICGLFLAEIIFRHLDEKIIVDHHACEGEQVRQGQMLCRISGRVRHILEGERVFLNFIQRLSGIATRTGEYVKKAAPYGVTILDTRKTMPLWRELDKYAVRTGGGCNHRMGLYDMILVKDNHIDAAGGIHKALKIVQELASKDLPIEVEVRNLDDLEQVLKYKDLVDYVMLDNMDPDDIRKAVRKAGGVLTLEASGGITLDNIEQYAGTTVDRISLGDLTHSVKALDMSLLFFGNKD